VLLVDKPAGITSHDVVAIVRRAVGERRVGHAGTLDPFATGLLVLLLGRGTRLLPYIDGEPKVYEAEIEFGTETDTDDATGTSSRSAPIPTRAAVDAAIVSLTGTFEQLPPAFSAKKVEGRRAYAAARAGKPVELRPSRVTVHAWERLHDTGEALRVRITCAGGTYIRALARDLGRLSGSAAHLRQLRRVRSGPFGVESADALETVRERPPAPLPLVAAIPSMPVQKIAGEELSLVAQGRRVAARTAGARAALLDDTGALVAIAERDGEQWQPKVVLA
jgi:tRNA pseudouridine55 synthase